jgi:hypothetical protein
MAHRLILIVPDGADSLLSILDRYMQEWVSANNATDADNNTTSAAVEEDAYASKPAPSPENSPPNTQPLLSNPATSSAALPALSTVQNFIRKLATPGEVIPGSEDRTVVPVEPAHTTRPLLNTQDLPFEMHAFEALLTTVMALETQEFNRVNSQVQVILNYFRSGTFFPVFLLCMLYLVPAVECMVRFRD